MPTPQSRFILRAAVLFALIGLASVIAYDLQIVRPDIPNDLSFVWVGAAVLLCAAAGAYVAARGATLPIGVLAGAVVAACSVALITTISLGAHALYMVLHVRPHNVFRLYRAVVLLELTPLAHAIAVGAAAGAALGTAGWAGQRYSGRRVAAAVANRLEQLACAARAAAR